MSVRPISSADVLVAYETSGNLPEKIFRPLAVLVLWQTRDLPATFQRPHDKLPLFLGAPKQV